MLNAQLLFARLTRASEVKRETLDLSRLLSQFFPENLFYLVLSPPVLDLAVVSFDVPKCHLKTISQELRAAKPNLSSNAHAQRCGRWLDGTERASIWYFNSKSRDQERIIIYKLKLKKRFQKNWRFRTVSSLQIWCLRVRSFQIQCLNSGDNGTIVINILLFFYVKAISIVHLSLC